MAESWHQAGLIPFEAVARFRMDLWQNASLNHDAHLHVNVGEAPGLLLDAKNDVYRCRRAASAGNGILWYPVSC